MASNVDIDEETLDIIQELEDNLTSSSRENSIINEKFLQECLDLQKANKIEIRAITQKQIDSLIIMLQTKNNKAPQYYYYLKNYTVSESQPPQLLDKAGKVVHTSVGTQGRFYMEKEGQKFWCNMTRTIIEIFLKYSEQYQIKRKRTVNHGLVVKPIRSENFNSRMQIDLVDMQSCPDGEYKWALNCQDHLTKFCHLRPIKSKSALDVAKELYIFFCQFGAPVILQSDNGKEFRNKLVESLKLLLPGLDIVHGRARRPQTQGSVERSNRDWQGILGD